MTSFGIITDLIACPQCGVGTIMEKCHVTGEESVACDHCGYTRKKTLEGTSTHKGYGCIHYVAKDKDNTETIVRLRSPLSLLGKHNIVMDLQSNYDTEKSSFYVWNEEKKEIECIMGTKQMTLEQFYEQQKLEAEYHAQFRFGLASSDEESPF